MTRAHFKFMAKHQLRGNIGTLFLASLLFSLAMIALLAIPAVLYFVLPKELGVVTYFIIAGVGSLIMLFYSFFAFPAFNIGYIMMIQKIAKQPSEKVRAREIFRGFQGPFSCRSFHKPLVSAFRDPRHRQDVLLFPVSLDYRRESRYGRA